jgi:hypothetical protein
LFAVIVLKSEWWTFVLRRAMRLGAAAATAGVLLLGACAAPEFNYVKNSRQMTYFKVPHDWHSADTKMLDDVLSGTNPDSVAAQQREQSWWSVLYDASPHPTAEHLVTGEETDEPVVYARVSPLTPEAQNEISLDSLRDLFLPVTDTARQQAAETSTLSGFQLLRDQVLTPSSGLHGVRVTYEYEMDNSVLHTFDQIALVNSDSSKLYELIIRCTSRCYSDRSSELNDIATSFTVRSSS